MSNIEELSRYHVYLPDSEHIEPEIRGRRLNMPALQEPFLWMIEEIDRTNLHNFSIITKKRKKIVTYNRLALNLTETARKRIIQAAANMGEGKFVDSVNTHPIRSSNRVKKVEFSLYSVSFKHTDSDREKALTVQEFLKEHADMSGNISEPYGKVITSDSVTLYSMRSSGMSGTMYNDLTYPNVYVISDDELFANLKDVDIQEFIKNTIDGGVDMNKFIEDNQF